MRVVENLDLDCVESQVRNEFFIVELVFPHSFSGGYSYIASRVIFALPASKSQRLSTAKISRGPMNDFTDEAPPLWAHDLQYQMSQYPDQMSAVCSRMGFEIALSSQHGTKVDKK